MLLVELHAALEARGIKISYGTLSRHLRDQNVSNTLKIRGNREGRGKLDIPESAVNVLAGFLPYFDRSQLAWSHHGRGLLNFYVDPKNRKEVEAGKYDSYLGNLTNSKATTSTVDPAPLQLSLTPAKQPKEPRQAQKVQPVPQTQQDAQPRRRPSVPKQPAPVASDTPVVALTSDVSMLSMLAVLAGHGKKDRVLTARKAAKFLHVPVPVLRQSVAPYRRFGNSEDGDRWRVSDLLKPQETIVIR